ncbi:formate dehydrogenase accessory sulfurtransferase FdhD [Thioalkalivibrio sp. HK1]|uniref:formate dehydrogenase accessory sulfurtransferase FdhD n=1 Tax=Thioalkalivibrio sp. HK1 TaxID=1469245 RepID=UPI000471273C|nr:formate dehydrogenase accessory sulfurtransferase FdhD [Thioalkalivibrio sp. HK1]
MNEANADRKPQMTRAGLAPTHAVLAVDEYGAQRELHVAGERPLTLKVDGREIVTLMTLGTHPEALALGYLRNQRLFENIEDIRSVEVDWDRERVDISTVSGKGIADPERKLEGRIVTTGCGQGTVFSCTLDKVYETRLPPMRLTQSGIYALLEAMAAYNAIYRQAGAVHGCALCHGSNILSFIEDVGRHNAADAISGLMWLDSISGADKVFYTTGRLTSEIVMKAALMGIPAIVSRSGVTQMGLELAEALSVMMVARAKGRHFLVYHGADRIEFDAIPVKRQVLDRGSASSLDPRRGVAIPEAP